MRSGDPCRQAGGEGVAQVVEAHLAYAREPGRPFKRRLTFVPSRGPARLSAAEHRFNLPDRLQEANLLTDILAGKLPGSHRGPICCPVIL